MAARIAITIVKITAKTIGVIKFNVPPPFKLFNTKLTICNKMTAQIKVTIFHTDGLHYLYTFILK